MNSLVLSDRALLVPSVTFETSGIPVPLQQHCHLSVDCTDFPSLSACFRLHVRRSLPWISVHYSQNGESSEPIVGKLKTLLLHDVCDHSNRQLQKHRAHIGVGAITILFLSRLSYSASIDSIKLLIYPSIHWISKLQDMVPVTGRPHKTARRSPRLMFYALFTDRDQKSMGFFGCSGCSCSKMPQPCLWHASVPSL